VQAESEQDKREWVHALQTVTANLLGISVPGAPDRNRGRKSSTDVGRESAHVMGSGMSLAEEVPVHPLFFFFFYVLHVKFMWESRSTYITKK
jgi:hypothetical protein